MTKNIKFQFGQKVRQVRLSQSMSQEKLAFECNLHRTYISDIERGTRNVALDNIEKIALALNVQPKDLLDFTTLENNEQKGISGGKKNED
ncbi:helix-turn-helix domain-containing protein [Bacillus altitudinis]|uniref:helix-turn-helix domain-containing protein n=1 Tax=Bacillus altitudinis TaxID=293387 RepID=UPI0009AE2DF2|nr:helix-turn-helix transcriptional regulator [Bacillus altitudinis]OPW88460.1 transcriptional regulator [Bacillus altitudinis]